MEYQNFCPDLEPNMSRFLFHRFLGCFLVRVFWFAVALFFPHLFSRLSECWIGGAFHAQFSLMVLLFFGAGLLFINPVYIMYELGVNYELDFHLFYLLFCFCWSSFFDLLIQVFSFLLTLISWTLCCIVSLAFLCSFS